MAGVIKGKRITTVPKCRFDAEVCGALLMGGVGQLLHSALGGEERWSEERVTRELQTFMRRVLCIQEEVAG